MLGALPGIREIRSALAGGYLWIAFFWLALDPSIGGSNFDSEPWRSAHHLGDAAGQLALGVAVTFTAYLIGTLFNEMRGLAARLYLRARQSTNLAPSVDHRVEQLRFERSTRWTKRRERRESHSRLRRSQRQRLPSGDGRAQPTLFRWINRFNRIVMEGFLLGSRGVEITLRLPEFMTVAIIETGESLREVLLGLVRRLTSIRLEPYRPFVTQHGVTAITRYLDLKKPPEPLSPGSPTVADVIADFPVIRTRLIHKSPETVSEYDRLRAEADFRSAIVFPLLAIIVVFVIKVSWWWAAAGVVLLVLLATARVKRREAGDILADTLGVVDAPCVEAAQWAPKFGKRGPSRSQPPAA